MHRCSFPGLKRPDREFSLLFPSSALATNEWSSRLLLKCDGTRAETRFRLSAKRTSPFKLAGTSVQSTACSRDVRISGSNAGYTMFRGSVKKPDFVFRRNGRVHLNRRGRQFSRLLVAEMRESAVVMLDTPCSEVV